MNFSTPITLEGIGPIVAISPSDTYVASVSQRRLIVVRRVTTLKITHSFTCADSIHSFSWSPNSSRVLCYLKKTGVVQIISIDNTDQICTVDEGLIGITSATWLPDSQHFLTTTEFCLHSTIWSILGVPVARFKYPKNCSSNFAVSPNGRYMASLERHEHTDYLSLFDCKSDWCQLYNTRLDTHDAVGVLWSPTGLYITVWDNSLRYHIAIYSLDGRCLKNYSAYDIGKELLGIKSVSWSPTSELLAIGSYDQCCRLLSSSCWSCLATLPHPVDKSIYPNLGLSPILHSSNQDDDACGMKNRSDVPHRSHRIEVYEKVCSTQIDSVPSDRCSNPSSTNKNKTCGVAYHILKDSFVVSSIEPDVKTPCPKIGIGLLAFSQNGRFLATRNDNCAHCVWIWSVDCRLSLFSLLLHKSGSVTNFSWDPSSPARLALCTGSGCVFVWSPQGCLAVQTPERYNFVVKHLRWLNSGEALLLISDTQFCLCHFDGADDAVANIGQPLWKPPSQKTSHHLPNHLVVDSPMPVGMLGASTGAVASTPPNPVDGPNWLRRRADAPRLTPDPPAENDNLVVDKLMHPHRQTWG